MNKSIYILPVIATGFLIALIYAFKPDNSQDTHSTQSLMPIQQTDQNKHVDLENNHLSKTKKMTLPEFLHPLSNKELASITIPQYLKEKQTENSSYFLFNQNQVEQMKEGDQFQISLPKFGLNKIAIIDDVDPIEDGTVRISGTFKNSTENLSDFTITQTKDDAYAIIRLYTEDKDYIIEVKNGIGMLDSSPNDDINANSQNNINEPE